MAKRKRLTPAQGDYLASPALSAGPASLGPAPIASVAGEAASAAALAELSQAMQAARDEGRLIEALPIEAIAAGHLVRDRIALDEDEMGALMASLRARGQQTPIEVVKLAAGRYGLISGWRRIMALKELRRGLGDRYGEVLGLLRRPRESRDAYLAMIEENEIRANLSHYERARIVVRATDRGVFADDAAALSALFASVPRARRSKIRSFVGIVRALDGALRFPEALSERVGLDLAQALRDRPELARQIGAALKAAPPQDAAAERALLTGVLEAKKPVENPAPKQSQTPASEPKQTPEVLGQWSGLTLRRRGARLELDGAAADAAFEADLAAWLAQRMGG